MTYSTILRTVFVLTFFTTSMVMAGRELAGSEIVTDVTLSVPSHYATIQDALDAIEFKRIARGTTVTIQVANGTYSYSSEIIVSHPDGQRIEVLGNTTTPASCTINFTGNANGFVVADGKALGLLDGFKLDGDNKTGIGVYALRGGHITTGTKMTVTDFDRGILAESNSTIYARGVTSTNNGNHGIMADKNSSIDCEDATATYNGYVNIVALHNSSIQASNATATHGQDGLNAWMGSSINAVGAVIQNNTTGIFCNDGSHIYVVSATVSGNGTNFAPLINVVGNNNSYIKK